MPIRTLPAAIAAAFLSLAPLASLAKQPPAQQSITAAERPVNLAETAAEHAAEARRFESEARRYSREAAEHAKEAAVYRQRARLLPKANYAALAVHCERLSKDLKAAAKDARETASLHAVAAKVLSQK